MVFRCFEVKYTGKSEEFVRVVVGGGCMSSCSSVAEHWHHQPGVLPEN